MLEVTQSRVTLVVKKKEECDQCTGSDERYQHLSFAFLLLLLNILENVYENTPLKCLPVREQIHFLCYCFLE